MFAGDSELSASPVQDPVELPPDSSPSASSARPHWTSYDRTLFSASPEPVDPADEDELTEMPATPMSTSRRRESVVSIGRNSNVRSPTSTVRLSQVPAPGGRRPPSRKGTIGGISVEEVEHRFVHPQQQEFYDDNAEETNEELGIRANIWPAYLEEAFDRDEEMLDAWHKTLDVLLIFAALFSGVLSQFLSNTSSMLQPDSAGQSAMLLAEMLKIMQNPGSNATLTPPDQILAFTSPSGARWVNGLWFTSLGLSLTAALAAVLSKEWLAAYVSDRPTQPKKRALQRQRRRESLDRWMLPAMISLLPMLMHLALLVFFTGLIIFLWILDLIIGLVLTLLFAGIVVYYFGTTIVAVMYPNCPYQTPVATYLRPMFHEFGWVTESAVSAAEMTARALAWLVTSADDNHTRDTAVLATTGVPGGAHAVILADSGAHTLARTRLEDMLRRVSNAASVLPGGELAAEKQAQDAIPDCLHLIHAYIHLSSIYRFYRFALDGHGRKIIHVRRYCQFLEKCANSRVPGARALVVALRVSDGQEDRDDEIFQLLKGHADGTGRLPGWALHKLVVGAVYHRVNHRPAFAKRVLPHLVKIYVRTEEMPPPLRQAFILALCAICVPGFDLFGSALTLEVVPMDLQKRVTDSFVVQSLPRLFDSKWDDVMADHRADLLLPLSLAAQSVSSTPVYKELIQDMRWDVALKAPTFKAVAFPCLTRFTDTLNDLTPLKSVESYALELLRGVAPQGLFALGWLGTVDREALTPSLFSRSAIPILVSVVKEELSGGQDNPHARGIVSGASMAMRIVCSSSDHQEWLFTEPMAEQLIQVLQLGRDAKFEFKTDMIRAATDVAVQLCAALDKGDPAARAMVRKLFRLNILGVLRPYFDNLGLGVNHILIWTSVLLRVWCAGHKDTVVDSCLVGWLRKDALNVKMHQNKEYAELWKLLNEFHDRVRNRKHPVPASRVGRVRAQDEEKECGRRESDMVVRWEEACKRYRDSRGSGPGRA
ncbi:hypothetical protein RhiJN_07059 [Ceratobasidium sp. AG-Ba]|nr:hypothetical protein RhiJN_07059 [Ceratobasidium sp. AG-Ba]